MKFTQYMSGSKGNLYGLESGSDRLMIDCGVNWRQLTRLFDLDRGNICGCLIGHLHQDHCKSMDKVNDVGIPVYAPKDEFEKDYVHEIEYQTEIGPFTIIPFPTYHTKHSTGYVIGHSGEWLLFVVDAKTIPVKVRVPYSIIAIEASFDEKIVQTLIDNEQIHPVYASHIRQHLEINETKRYLREFCDLSRCRELHLLHLSKTLPDHEAVRKEFENEFKIPTVVA